MSLYSIRVKKLHWTRREVLSRSSLLWRLKCRSREEWLTDWPLLFISSSTALTGVRWAGDEMRRMVGQTALMNHCTRAVVVASPNVIGSRCTRHRQQTDRQTDHTQQRWMVETTRTAVGRRRRIHDLLVGDMSYNHATDEGRGTISGGWGTGHSLREYSRKAAVPC